MNSITNLKPIRKTLNKGTRKILDNAGSKWRITFVIICTAFMLLAIDLMYSPGSELVDNGRAYLSGVDFASNKLVTLDGHWEFYWGRLLTPQDFKSGNPPQADAYMKVPGVWQDREAGKTYPPHGVATYRLALHLPSTLKDPAIHLQHVSDAYTLYANGRLIAEVGKVSESVSDFRDDEKSLILDLPKDTQDLELVFQVANWKYNGAGGLRQSPVIGSKQVLERQRMMLFVLQVLFIGSIFIFAVYYFLLFLLQTKNKSALLFSLFCLITVLRSLIWGEAPLVIFFPDVSFDARLFINYLTGNNLIPIMILFVLSMFPREYPKTISALALLPTLFFDALLVTPPSFISTFTKYMYILVFLQLIYLLCILIKAIFSRKEHAIVMFMAICVFALSISADILYYIGVGSITLSYMFLFGNFAVIVAMSFIQARQQANIYKKLVVYNEKLVEADKLKDKIMATEWSFLQAQIKPHFLYNAFNAIANVCEKDGKKAAKLILDLAIYLRGSLEFNNLDKMVTIEKELEFVDTYFNIEQARFGPKIHLAKEIAIALDCQIPGFILQPLVENAVRHGISKKPGEGTVSIRMKQDSAGICIEVEDDGMGIDSAKLALLLSGEKKGQGVGLLNIHYRLLRLYGRGLTISSEVGCGTCVQIVIPEERE
ncbi:histidine kinase [Desulfosporosinus sp. PR]|uniref:sensor histidine kinase n=1 Tax=Candidatus Desulfosporosinus nitrosoreducens TaxID=3401928 RepID=UPI0027E7A4CF|nr:histidine kinase [Desulfosporosinus sp. PR]MDQ7094466.1 histidine kinase [Desulfosporosinus sp. PR]